MSKKKASGNPRNRAGGRVTAPSVIPKRVRQQVRTYKERGGTLAQLQAIQAALEARQEESS